MNFIVVIYDTLRHDHVGCNGMRPIHTPNWDRLAASGWNFTRCYTASYPSLPHRCDCATGRFVFPFYGWQPLPEDEVHLVRKLTDAGYRTHIISDGGLPISGGLGRGFGSHELVDVGLSDVDAEQCPMPCAPHKSRTPDRMREFWALRAKLIENGDEKEWPQARVMRAAADWLRISGTDSHDAAGGVSPRNPAEPFFLWIESWRIHETWIDPPEYVEMYDPGYEGEWVALPSYSPTIDYLTPAELNHVRAMYAASVTFSDKWFGHLMEALEENGLLDDTAVIVSSDHGWSLGDHGRTGKHAVPVPPQDAWPLYEECTHVPLIVRMPGQMRAERCAELVHHADILPTVLDYAGIEGGPTVKGVSWRQILEGKELHTRDIAVTCSGMSEFPKSGNTRITITSADHTLILPTQTQSAELYNLALDPGQTLNLIRRHPEVANDLYEKFLALILELGIDEAKYKTWEGILGDSG